MQSASKQAAATHSFIKTELKRRGSSMAQAAREMGVTQGSVSLVSRGLHRSRRIEAGLAKALSMETAVLFKDRYPDGKD